MAELSNDPLGELHRTSPTTSTTRLRAPGASWRARPACARFVYMSSCSVYGVAEAMVDEDSPVNPQTAYAECKVLVERDVGALAGDDFIADVPAQRDGVRRLPRMRFDIVLNNLVGLAWTDGRDRDDERRHAVAAAGARPRHRASRPSRAGGPGEAVHGEIFNVGSNEQNYRVREIAETWPPRFPAARRHFGPAERRQPQLPGQLRQDRRGLPGFACEWDARPAPPSWRRSSRHRPRRGEVHRPGLTRLKQLQHLLDTAAVDATSSGAAPTRRSRHRSSRSGRRHHDLHRDHPEGVSLIDLELREDDRGFFARAFCRRSSSTPA